MNLASRLLVLVVVVSGWALAQDAPSSPRWISFAGWQGPGNGKHIVLISGDEEYRSEEALPMLAKVLAVRHGFRCTVLFSQNPETGEIDPKNQTHIPGMHLLAGADLAVLGLRFRELPDEDMKHFVDFVESGKPVIGLRTSTHAFSYRRNKESQYRRYSFRNDEWRGGFGRQVLGETWINHHGRHGSESTRGVVEAAHKDHPVLRGVDDVWGPTDVYGVRNELADATILLRGQVIAGMKPTDPPVEGKKNEPMMPLVWLRNHTWENGNVSRIMCSTMGAATDFASAGFRRCIVNGCYWAVGLEAKIPKASNVGIVGEFNPTDFGFNTFKKGVRPADHLMRAK